MASYKKNIAKHMGADKYVIACTHLIALPGAPAYDRAGGMRLSATPKFYWTTASIPFCS
jgi:hypothetical protein